MRGQNQSNNNNNNNNDDDASSTASATQLEQMSSSFSSRAVDSPFSPRVNSSGTSTAESMTTAPEPGSPRVPSQQQQDEHAQQKKKPLMQRYFSSNNNDKRTGRKGFVTKVLDSFKSNKNKGIYGAKVESISGPLNPVHVTHIGLDEKKLQFVGLPMEWRRLLEGQQRSHAQARP